MTELCRAFGISRKTGYKWIARFKQGGAVALADRSRASIHHPNATLPKVVELVVAARRMHPTWGPKKAQVWLRDRGWPIPARSTIGKILKREGLPLDNNLTERALRGMVIGRKNHYGSRSKRGTEVAALYYSLVETVKLNNVNPSDYIYTPAIFAIEFGEALLPWEYAALPDPA